MASHVNEFEHGFCFRENLSPEERDARTVFCMQLAARLRPRDLEQFFSSVGKVNWNASSVKVSTFYIIILVVFKLSS